MYISNEERKKIHAIIHSASAASASVGAGLAQIPLSDNALITPIQIGMIISIGLVLDIELSKSSATAILGTVATSTIGRSISQVALGWMPGIGNTINASTAIAVTEATGWATVKYFENMSDEESKKYNKAKEQGRQEAKAEYDIKLKKMNEKISKVAVNLKEYEQLEYFIIGAFAIGISAANADGDMSNDQRDALQLLTVGLGYNMLPSHILEKVSELFYIKPTFNDAMNIINRVDKDKWHIFDEVVQVILEIDNYTSQENLAFRAAWDEKFKTA